MRERDVEVLVVGGGIGGLAAALALHRTGFRVRVVERAPELREVGAGLGLWANAVRALDHLGLGGEIRRMGIPFRRIEGCSSSGRLLTRLDADRLLDDPRAASYIVHRADLQGILQRALPAELMQSGAECTGVEQTPASAVARFRGLPSMEAAIVVGADGFHSAVRRALWGETPVRYSGQTCYRGVARLTPDEPHTLREIQGAGQRGSVCTLSEGRVYWWAAVNAPHGEADDPGRRRDELLRRFAGWPFQLPQAIAASEGEILRNDLVDRPPLKRWSRGRVTLLGDAAHPMLPNLGQGACTAIEDGLVLARSLAAHGPTPLALRAYEGERIRRTTAISTQSWLFGVPARWTSGPAVALRERLIRWTPDAVMERQIREHVGYDAGPLPPARQGA